MLDQLTGPIREKIWTMRRFLKKEEVRSISRRYFISNGFDGTLTSIGIAVGSYLSGVPTGMTVFKVGVGAAVGLATSGVWSVWEIEKAEKLAKLHKQEQAMLKDLSETTIMEQMDEARAINAASSGVGPLIGIMTPIFPFLLEGVFYDMLTATLLAVLIGMGNLFAFGSYMAKVSKRTWYVAGFRMALAGLVVAAINVLLPG